MKLFGCFLLLGVVSAAQVPFARVANGELDRGNWLTYSGNLEAHRYSPLKQITTANVGSLKPMWIYQPAIAGRFETSPVVVDGMMIISEPPTVVTALDPKTGRRLWRYERQLPADLQTIGFGRVNRGVAVLDDMVYVATLDAHLVALDSKSGAVRWDVPVADYKLGYCLTAAPLAIKGAILTGTAGGEAGIRGFIDAYHPKTGKQLWRFYTIPGPGEAGNESWGTDAKGNETWKTGGGSTWVTGSYDALSNTVYWGVGNPGPDWNGDFRQGDNLYTCSLVALDGGTGKLKWHFQFTPHDTHDWDATEIPVLADMSIRGKPRKVVIMANRNAFYYILDRNSGEYLVGAPYAKQTWAKGLDDKGRPEVIPGTEPSVGGDPGVAEFAGCDKLVQPVIRSGEQHVLRGSAGNGLLLLQRRGRV